MSHLWPFASLSRNYLGLVEDKAKPTAALSLGCRTSCVVKRMPHSMECILPVNQCHRGRRNTGSHAVRRQMPDQLRFATRLARSPRASQSEEGRFDFVFFEP